MGEGRRGYFSELFDFKIQGRPLDSNDAGVNLSSVHPNFHNFRVRY